MKIRTGLGLILAMGVLLGCSPNKTPEQEAAAMKEASDRFQEVIMKDAIATYGKEVLHTEMASKTRAALAASAASAP